MLHVQVVGHVDIGIELSVLIRLIAIARAVARVRLAIQLSKTWLGGFLLLLNDGGHLILHIAELVA